MFFIVNMIHQSNQFFKKFSISDAAIAYKKPRSSIMKYIRNGELQLDYYKLIDYNQLVRVFGELSSPIKDEKDDQIQKLRSEINELKVQLNQLKNANLLNKHEFSNY